MFKLFMFTVLFLCSVSGDHSFEPVLNPGCNECQDNDTTLVYIKAEDYTSGNNSYIHQVWDFTSHIPYVLFVLGSNRSTVNINWDGNKPTDIVTNETHYSFAMIFTDIIEYNDTEDRGYFQYTDTYHKMSLKGVRWRQLYTKLTSSEARIKMRGELPHRVNETNGHVEIDLVSLPFLGQSPELPRLHHNVRSTQVDVSMEGLRGRFVAGRFAQRYVFASSNNATDLMTTSVMRSIDDEYTPGVFERIIMMTPRTDWQPSSHVLLKPVAYNVRERSVSSSVPARLDRYNGTEIPRDSLLEKFYHNLDKEPFTVEMIASFGQSGDGFYKQTNYTDWTYVLGYGEPAYDNPSYYFWIFLLPIVVIPPLLLCAPLWQMFLIIKKYVAYQRQSPPFEGGSPQYSNVTSSEMEPPPQTSSRICILSYVFLGVGVLPNAHVRILTPPPDVPEREEEDLF